MNFLAIPTLKNERACFRFPISIRPRRWLKVTLDRDRTGIGGVGSFRRGAAVITTSATLMSFFSTAVVLRALRASARRYAFLRAARRALVRLPVGVRLGFPADRGRR